MVNNKEKYKKTINKIEISDELVEKAIKNAIKYENERMLNMEKEKKLVKIRQVIITLVTLMGLTSASYAGYLGYVAKQNHDMKYKDTTTLVLEGMETDVSTIEHTNVENNEIIYNIETPDAIKYVQTENGDRYESIYNDGTYPDIYMEISILDNERKDDIKEKYADLCENYSQYNSETQNLKIGRGEYNAIKYHYSNGNKWNSEVSDVYLVDINDEKFMVISINYFMEATEGFGSRFIQLLDTLEIYANINKEDTTTTTVPNHDMKYKNTTTLVLEGMETDVSTIEHTNVENNEIIYNIETPDATKYVQTENGDRYESIYNNGTYPDIYMEISILDNERKDDIKEKYADLCENYSQYNSETQNLKIGRGEYNAIKYHYSNGNKWNSEVSDVYLVDINDEKFMVISINYFMEATEGFGSQFIQLLKTLEIYK